MADWEVLELGGVKTPLDETVLTPPIIETMRAGKYENARIKTLRQMVEAGDRIVDIGGGIGFTATLMALTGLPAVVVSVDGHPGLQTYAEALYRLNGVQVAGRNALVVTTKTKDVERFYLSRHFWGSSMIPDVKAQTEVVDVAVLNFDELIADYRPTMLVIDLEVLREYLTADASSGPLERMALTGVSKVVIHIPMHLAGPAGVKRVFDFFSSQGFYYNIDYSRGGVVLFSRLPS